ncbi:hypothetical protein C1H76_2389 [Elsinoe australis]|uniref:Uncharacterized protein n=1 Tax=Elsinoe australis TaxID=40998 RepID=A0A4U7B2V4_9PEZI|nr:hypothetical protein C1H76_2389 [Elsinoe australis]
MSGPDSRCEQSARATLLTTGDKQEDAETYTPRRLSRHSRFLPWADGWWLWETLACFLASSCLIAIIALLILAHGDPVADWEFGSFTLNSIVALLSTIMRVALMVPIAGAIGQQKWLWFQTRQTRQPGRASSNPLEDIELIDSASRGPWGGLVFLTRRFGLHLGTLGAILGIVSLGMGTFTQIVVTSKIHVVNSTITAPSRVESFDIDRLLTDRGIEFRRAFDQALLNANDTQLEMPTCPTGNCHWPIFSTLGMCGSCQDQTSNIQIQCGLTLMSSKALQPWNWTYCAYTYADGDQLYTPREGSDEFGRDYNFDALPVVANYSRARENVGLTIKTPTVRVFLVSAGNTFSDSNTGYYTFRIHDNTYRLRPGPTIHDCKFVWCIQAYNVSVSKGTQTTHKLGQWTDFTQSGDGRDRVLHFNMTNIPSAIIDSIHSGHRNWTVPRIQGDTPTKSVYAETKLYDEPPHDPSNLTFSEFRAHGSRTLLVTNAMRRTGEIDSMAHLYAGTAFTPEQYYDIRFWWLMFPAALIALSTLLLGLTIWTTHELQAEHWKNDALALLYTSVDPVILYSSRQPRDLADHKVTFIRSEGSAVLRKGC